MVAGMIQKGGIMKLTGKKALITGGNSGIGLATARLFIAEGAQVAITGRDQKTLDEAVAELGPHARGYRADITVAEDRERVFAALAKDFGNLTLCLPTPASPAGRLPARPTRLFSRR
jgi:NAD(P)-dependent dehydrogenase (short-subunit alcohol dehydrogenase family)